MAASTASTSSRSVAHFLVASHELFLSRIIDPNPISSMEGKASVLTAEAYDAFREEMRKAKESSDDVHTTRAEETFMCKRGFVPSCTRKKNKNDGDGGHASGVVPVLYNDTRGALLRLCFHAPLRCVVTLVLNAPAMCRVSLCGGWWGWG